MTVVSAPLYVYFGWLSDRVGRKPVMVGGMLLALVLYFPASHWIAGAANPALVEAQRATPVFVETDPATCSVQFDPVGTAKFVSACDIAKSALVTKGISFATRQSHRRADARRRRHRGVPIAGGEGLSARRSQGAEGEDRRTRSAPSFRKRAIPRAPTRAART